MSTHEPKDTAKPAGGNGNGDLSRRDFLLKLGLGLNVLAGAMIAIPLVGYVMSSFVKKLPLKWTALGPLDKFPEATTRLATYENPYHREWDGEAAVIPCWVRRVHGEEFQVFAINCTHLGCPVRWFEESKALHVSLSWRRYSMKMASMRRDRPRAASTSINTRWRTANSSSRPA